MFLFMAHFSLRVGQSSLAFLKFFLQALQLPALVIQDMFLALPLLGQLFLLLCHRLLQTVNHVASFH